MHHSSSRCSLQCCMCMCVYVCVGGGGGGGGGGGVNLSAQVQQPVCAIPTAAGCIKHGST